MAVALVSASFAFVVGALAGAALQRWGDADRATEHHTEYPPELEPKNLQTIIDEIKLRDVSLDEQVNWRYWLHG